MNFLVAAATSSLAPYTSTDFPPRKRVRRNPKINTYSGGHVAQLHPLLEELISRLQPLTPLEHDSICRAFYAGIAHESSSSAHCHRHFTFNDSDIDSSDSELSSLDVLAHTVDQAHTKEHLLSPWMPSTRPMLLRRQLSEETFTTASLLGQMRYLPIRGSSNQSKTSKVALRASQKSLRRGSQKSTSSVKQRSRSRKRSSRSRKRRR